MVDEVDLDVGAGTTMTAMPPGASRSRPHIATDAERRRDLVIPDDPTVLSYLLSGIVQIELPRRQVLLEAATTADRLEALVRLDRIAPACRPSAASLLPDPRLLRGPRRS